MTQNRKGQAEARPIPNAVVNHDATESIATPAYVQALAQFVFRRRFLVVYEPISDRFRKRVCRVRSGVTSVIPDTAVSPQVRHMSHVVNTHHLAGAQGYAPRGNQVRGTPAVLCGVSA